MIVHGYICEDKFIYTRVHRKRIDRYLRNFRKTVIYTVISTTSTSFTLRGKK